MSLAKIKDVFTGTVRQLFVQQCRTRSCIDARHSTAACLIPDKYSMVCSEERAKRVSEARSQRAGQSRHGIMLEQVKQQQQAAQQALDEADPDAPAQPAAPEERNLTLMIKADVQVCNAACHPCAKSFCVSYAQLIALQPDCASLLPFACVLWLIFVLPLPSHKMNM